MARTKRGGAETVGAVGYVRVSTDDQVLSVEAQREKLRAWCSEKGMDLVAVYEDLGVSGGADLDKRPGLMAALDALTRGMVLVAVKRDRIARDTMNAAMIERLAERSGAKVLTCDGACDGDTPEAKLMRTMIDAFAEYERAIIRARTKTALTHKRERGERTSLHAPYGFTLADDGRTLLSNEREQALIEAIRAARQVGRSQRGILADLAAKGFTTRKGTALRLRQVQLIMERAQIA
jgi:DNA invertase Pin-like site-specific DNA recombinase